MKKGFFLLFIILSLYTPYSSAQDDFLNESIRFDKITETIYLESPMSFKYETGYNKIEKMSAKDELSKIKDDNSTTIFKKNNLSIESNYRKVKSSHLTNGLENKQLIKYSKDRLILSAGISNSYEYVDLTKNAKKIFFSPQFILNNHITIGLNNAINAETRTFEQGASLRYKPYFLKNTTFGLGGSIKQREDNTFTRKLEFNSEFYLR